MLPNPRHGHAAESQGSTRGSLLLALYFSIALSLTNWHQQWVPPAGHILVEDASHGDLRKSLMDSFVAMNAANKGIFHDDVSAVVASYFPLGPPLPEPPHTV